MTREELNECLSDLGMEIDKYYCQQDVCIPILGLGITRFEDTSLTQQELLDIIEEERVRKEYHKKMIANQERKRKGIE